MKHTNRQTTTATLTDLYRALDRRQAVTITYLADETRHVFAVNTKGVATRRTIKTGRTVETVRSIEIHEVRTTSDGDIALVAMCRLRGEERQLRLSRIRSYTVHRTGYVLTRPEPTVYEREQPAPTHDAQALFLHELARDQDDADYRPRRKLTQTDTDLAA